MEKLEILINFFEALFPSTLALPDDPTGMHIRSTRPDIRKVLGALELNQLVLQKVLHSDADFLYLHHPPIWEPLERLDGQDPWTSMLCELYRCEVSVLAHHTNLDCARPGMAEQWIEGLELCGVSEPLETRTGSGGYTVVTFLPPESLDTVRQAAFKAGAGVIGLYRECSFYLAGTGTYTPQVGTTPYHGQADKPETTEEIRLEMRVASPDLLQVVLSSLRAAHPYEEPVIDVYPLHPSGPIPTGLGRLVVLDRAIETHELFQRAQRIFLQECRMERPYREASPLLSKIALCPGSGGSLLPIVLQTGAQVYLTGDLSHHQLEKLRLHGITPLQVPHATGERYSFKTIFHQIRERAVRQSLAVEFVFEDEL